MSPDEKGVCWSCGTELLAVDYTREGTCPACRKQTHVCRNCRFYDTTKANQCREPIADPVSDKQRANFCDYFAPSDDCHQPGKDQESLRAAADELFKI
jgi:hypothetical protein